jgi:hypothetical protein
MLSQLEKKFEKDSTAIAPLKYVLEDIGKLTKKIIEKEDEIKNAMTYLKNKQDELGAYLIKFNTIKSNEEGRSNILDME